MQIVILVLALLSGAIYRLGGWGNEGRELLPMLPSWLFSKKLRRFGCPALSTIVTFMLGFHNPIVLLLHYGIACGAISTYCKFGGQARVLWYNWILTGLFYGFVMAPIAYHYGKWLPLIMSMVSLSVVITLWCELWESVWWEEIGRGFFYIAALSYFIYF